MAGPLLIVELPTVDTTRPEAAALVQACTEALGNGRCELSTGSDQAAVGLAVVSLRGPDALGALIEVGSRRSRSRNWRTQELSFQPQDARVERFRTLGFAIATLFREAEVEPAGDEARARAERRTTPDSRKRSAATPATPRGAGGNETGDATGEKSSSGDAERLNGGRSLRYPRGWLSAGALAGYDHELPTPWRWGGQLTFGIAPLQLPLFATLSGSYAMGESGTGGAELPEVSLSWATLGMGVATDLRLPVDFVLRVGGQGVLVDLSAHASDRVRGREESQRWIPGAQAIIELTAFASARWGFVLGTQVQQLSGPTSIALHNTRVARVAAVSWVLTAGVEFHPFQR